MKYWVPVKIECMVPVYAESEEEAENKTEDMSMPMVDIAEGDDDTEIYGYTVGDPIEDGAPFAQVQSIWSGI